MASVGELAADKCVICGCETLEKLTCVTSVGMQTLKLSCKARSRLELFEYLSSDPPKILVHSSCRKAFTRSKDIIKLEMEQANSIAEGPSKKILRSSVSPFDWKQLCFLCATNVEGSDDRRLVKTLQLDVNLYSICQERNDDWATSVLGRLQSCNDLFAADAVYHCRCLVRFRKGLPLEIGQIRCGRPESQAGKIAFNRLCEHLEMSCEYGMYSLEDLLNFMRDLTPPEQADQLYTAKHIKNLLIERYGEFIVFAEVKGRRNVVCFRNLCNFILSESWYNQRNADCDKERERIVSTAARLIAAQIREISFDMDFYPNLNDLKSESVEGLSPLLLVFLKSIIESSTKQNSIAQCIIQAARPRSTMMPLQLGLGIQVDHLFGSKFLVQHLSRLGFCCSYDEVCRYKKSVMNSNVSDCLRQPNGCDHVFTQFVADNVDHNICTLDGNGTFHGMGIIAASVTVAGGSFSKENHNIRRLPASVLTKEVSDAKKLEIVNYNKSAGAGLHKLSLRELTALYRGEVAAECHYLSTLWHIGGCLKSPTVVRPNWCGYMQTVSTGSHSSASVIHMLPIIDLNPSNESCILSTLLYVIGLNNKLDVTTACITFDQPLYIKAVDISTAERLPIVCRLGGFHLLMSYLGAIGYVMEGSGLEEVLGVIYGPNTVEHVVKGKAYARAVRGHIIVHDALTSALLCTILPGLHIEHEQGINDLQKDESVVHADDTAALRNLLSEVWSKKVDIVNDNSWHTSELKTIHGKLDAVKVEMSCKSRTGKLWINYMHFVTLVKQFIMAERTCNWDMHLKTVFDMLSLFAATGRNNYAKCARLYLQQMQELPTTNPTLHRHLSSGQHAIRRSDRFWAGLSADLVIEQTMMKSVKGNGGLTRGRGMHDSARALWVNTLSEGAGVHMSMSEVTELDCKASEHNEVGKARMARDWSDLQKIQDYIQNNSPFRFEDSSRLVSLSSGVTANAEDGINCDDAIAVGLSIQHSWNNLAYVDVKAKKNEKVKTLANLSNACSVDKEKVSIDVNSLFQRLVIVGERTADMKSFFKYELTHHPTSLFANGFMRKPNKPELCKVFTRELVQDTLPLQPVYVVDGGCLLHKVRWSIGKTFDEIVQQYLKYVTSHFGEKIFIVFDGYTDNPSTKDHEHKRRSSHVSKIAPDVSVNLCNKLTVDQDAFLANRRNKAAVITLLQTCLTASNIACSIEDGDADTGIALEAISQASHQHNDVVVFAEDTDILALLLFHRRAEMREIYMWSMGTRSQGSCNKVISISKLQQAIGKDGCAKILVLHAFGGCDTTSAIFGQGKGKILKKLSSDKSLSLHITILQSSEKTQSEVAEAGVRLMVALYGGKKEDTLESMRYAAYCKMLSTSFKRLQPERLPPSEGAASRHAQRVHQQVLTWESLGSVTVDPALWGWRLSGRELTPIPTDQPIAPEEIMHIIRCNCKGNCSTSKCSCRTNGLKCLSACGYCHGTECTNVEVPVVVEESDDENEYPEMLLDEALYFIDEEVVDSSQQTPELTLSSNLSEFREAMVRVVVCRRIS